MQLGIEWDETLPYTDPRNDEIAMEGAVDRYYHILGRPLIEESGTRWNYCGGATAILGHLISRASAMPLLEFARLYLFNPLGIEEVEWTKGSSGEASAAAGLRLRPRDLAKIGQLILNRGLWGPTRIVSQGWLEQCFVPRTQTSWRMAFGYHWYLDETNGVSWMAANGNGGQHILIAPSLSLVFVCTAGNYNHPRPNVAWELTNLVLSAAK